MPARLKAVQADITTLDVDAMLAIAAVRETLPELPGVSEVVFCRHSARDLAVHERLLRRHAAAGSET